MVKHLQYLDQLFDAIVYASLLIWALVVYFCYLLPNLFLYTTLVCLKQIFLATAHFGVHRSGPNFFTSLFDFSNNSVGLVEIDTHASTHHCYMQSKCAYKLANGYSKTVPSICIDAEQAIEYDFWYHVIYCNQSLL